uniref:Methyltransferase FkbM domain-containing protein n=1 Tax=viral metagenome TaxID=1070528 RepID=A0A6C0LQY6_9ZZZZ
MKIIYGFVDKLIDVTEICFSKLRKENIITIPHNDIVRANIFTDPANHILKKIYIFDDNRITEYDDSVIIEIDVSNNSVNTINKDVQLNNAFYTSKIIHTNLLIKYGTMNDELPEQLMAIIYLTGKEKILEIGGNIGRNSLTIAHILKKQNNKNLVVLESDTDISNQLRENRDINHFDFHIENSALSKRKLIQKDWITMESDVLLEGYKTINTITLEQLNNKYNIVFDTLILDCEGAFYFILMDMPEILNNIKLIIMENDYTDISHKEYIDTILKQNNFYVDFSLSGGWGPCFNNFFEVWKKNT